MLAVLLGLAFPVQAPPAVRLESDVMIPMRDGVRLATDLYRPITGSGPWPVILVRTPYNKVRDAERLRGLAAAGYVLAVQDVRGKYNSEGRVRIQADDAEVSPSGRLAVTEARQHDLAVRLHRDAVA